MISFDLSFCSKRIECEKNGIDSERKRIVFFVGPRYTLRRRTKGIMRVEAETVEFLRDIADHSERGDRDWIKRTGTVYELIESA